MKPPILEPNLLGSATLRGTCWSKALLATIVS